MIFRRFDGQLIDICRSDFVKNLYFYDKISCTLLNQTLPKSNINIRAEMLKRIKQQDLITRCLT